MRALFLGLVLVNVLYWTWASSVGEPKAAVKPALESGLPLLELIPRAEPAAVAQTPANVSASEVSIKTEEQGSEKPASADVQVENATSGSAWQTSQETSPSSTNLNPAPTRAAVQNLLAAVNPVDNPARCVTVGPFISLRQASDAVEQLNEAGLSTAQRVEESQVWVGHWVHLPSYPTRAAAVEVVEELRKQGIKDIYIEPSGELKNTVSLGLFTELARAEIRAGNVRKLGDVKPQIRNRSRDGLVYWIDAPLESGVSLDTDSLPHNASQELRLETVNCPSNLVGG